jgi:hypothetical protein
VQQWAHVHLIRSADIICKTRNMHAKTLWLLGHSCGHPSTACALVAQLQMLEQRRKLPPMVNDRSLFTRAAPFYDKSDPFYHSPSQRIGSNYTPSSMHAAAVLFEVFPKVSRPPCLWCSVSIKKTMLQLKLKGTGVLVRNQQKPAFVQQATCRPA